MAPRSSGCSLYFSRSPAAAIFWRRRRRRRSLPLSSSRQRSQRMFSSLIHPMRRSDKALASLKVPREPIRAWAREEGLQKEGETFLLARDAIEKEDDANCLFPARHAPLVSSAFPLVPLKKERDIARLVPRNAPNENTHSQAPPEKKKNSHDSKKKAATAEHLVGEENQEKENDDGNVADLGNDPNGGRRPFATPATASSAARFLNSALEGKGTKERVKKERQRGEGERQAVFPCRRFFSSPSPHLLSLPLSRSISLSLSFPTSLSPRTQNSASAARSSSRPPPPCCLWEVKTAAAGR